MKPYAYEVTTNRGTTYLVRAGSVAHSNAVMFGYQLKPLYEREQLLGYQTDICHPRVLHQPQR